MFSVYSYKRACFGKLRYIDHPFLPFYTIASRDGTVLPTGYISNPLLRSNLSLKINRLVVHHFHPEIFLHSSICEQRSVVNEGGKQNQMSSANQQS